MPALLTREARALSMLEEVTNALRSRESEAEIAEDFRGRQLRAKLNSLIGELESPSWRVAARLQSARGELARMKATIDESCSAALADFYVHSATLLFQRKSRATLRLALLGHGPSRRVIPRLFQMITHRVSQSGYKADLDDLEAPLNAAGEQLIALVWESKKWPVLVSGDTEAPVIGSDEPEGKSTLTRLSEEVSRISEAEGVIEMRDPPAAMASMMNSLASWIPFRTTPKRTTGHGGSGNGGGSASGNGGGSGGGGHNSGGSDGSGRRPNFRVDTPNDHNCAVSWRINFARAPFRAFGGPETPVDNYLSRGWYHFKVYHGANEYFTRDPVKVPENSPLILPFPPVKP
jgi:uncharacterized membrane protein YgcG